MNKMTRILTGLLFALLMITSSFTSALTLTIPDVDGSPSETLSFDVLAEGFTEVAAGQLFIEFDTTRLVYDNISSTNIPGLLTNVIGGRINLNWDTFSQPITLTDGEVLLSFTLIAKPDASQSAAVGFAGFNEIVDYSANEFDLTLNDGLVSFTPLDADDDDGALPLAFSLSQNYPNPFNPSTKIDFTVNDFSERYTFRVYNMAGQVIEERDLGVLNVGDHPIHFYGEGLASGLYLYEVSSSTQKASKLMMLVK